MPRLPVKTSSDSSSTVNVQTEKEASGPATAVVSSPKECFDGREHWDPAATWTEEEARRVRRKTDFLLLLPLALVFMVCQLDHANILNALTDNFLRDLHLTTADYDRGVLVNKIAVIISELPTQLLILKYGFQRLYPAIVVVWGVIAACQCLTTGAPTFLALRFLVGLLQGGWLPGLLHYMGLFYTMDEMKLRLGYLTSMYYFSHIVGNLTAVGLLKMRGLAGQPGWFWLFLIHGAITVLSGGLAWLHLPTSPSSARNVFTGRHWFTERERVIMVNKRLQESASKGNHGSLLSVTCSDVKAALMDKTLWILYISPLLRFVAHLPFAIYLSITLRKLGINTTDSNFLMIPSCAIPMVTILFLVKSSQHFKERTWHAIGIHTFQLPFVAVLIGLPVKANPWVRFSMLTTIVGTPGWDAILISWLDESCCSVKKSALATVIYSICGLVGVTIASHAYLPSDAPFYYRANKGLLVIGAFGAILIFAHQQILKRINRRRKAQWEAMSHEEQVEYEKVTTALPMHGNKRLDFVYPL